LEARIVSGPTAVREVVSVQPGLVLLDVFLQHAEAWRHLAALRAAPGHRGRGVGLVGLADGGGRVVTPADLDILADSDLEIALASRTEALCTALNRQAVGADARVLVVGGDVTWRRRVSLILEAGGIGTTEASHVEEAFSVARRVPIRGVVVDLLLPDPGIAVLLTGFGADETMHQVPVLLVAPSALTPGQQRDLRRVLARWSQERPDPVSELAGAVATALRDLTRATAACVTFDRDRPS
jgi:CheY-like chemotaxis protein